VKLLALDTSTQRASIAVVHLGSGGSRTLATASYDGRDHSSRLLTSIDECLSESKLALAEIRAIAVGTGPGSFTGLRIGMATAKGLAMAIDAPLWIASSLAAIASDAEPPTEAEGVAVIVDGHRNELFVSVFSADSTRALTNESVARPDALAPLIARSGLAPEKLALAGDGARLYPDELGQLGFLVELPVTHPSGFGVATVAARGRRRDLRRNAIPAYIRPAEAERRFPDGNPGGTFAPRPKGSK